MGQTSKHVLIFRLSAMGDVAMTAPVLRAAVAQNPNVKFTVVSRGFFKPFFNEINNVSFYAADVKGKHKGFLGLYKLSRELKKLKFDAIADFHNVLRTKILRSFFTLSRKKIAVINKGRAEKKALTRTKNKVFKQLKTSPERYADVLRTLGLQIDLSSPIFPEKEHLTAKILEITGKNHKKWIGIAPFAQHEGKVYPLDLIEKVIEKISSDENYAVFLFGGGKKETQILNNLAHKYTNTITVAGKLNLEEELILISHLDCMLSMDSANAHMSAMFGVKTITIWGATHPFAGFAPFNQPKDNRVLPDLEKYPNLPCSIYGNKICDGYEDVMRSILPEKIIEKIM